MSEYLQKQNEPEHFETCHENGKAFVCLMHDGECRALAEITEGYTPEEEALLAEATIDALHAVDKLTYGRASEIFDGLHIVIGEGLTDGGGKAIAEENKILLNGRNMLLSVAEMRDASGAYDDTELTGFPDEQLPGGALEYTLTHEMGHILDVQTNTGIPYHRVDASESPTKYGREFDQFNDENKDHEAFAEGFAHLVYDMPVSETMQSTVRQTIHDRLFAVDSLPEEDNIEEMRVVNAEKIKLHLEDYFVSDSFAECAEAASGGNFERKSDFIGDIVQYSVLFPDATPDEIHKYASSQSERVYSDSYDSEREIQKTNYIVHETAELLGITSDDIETRKEDIARYVFDAYVTSGFIFHGFNSAAETSIRQHGLSGEKREWDNDEINEIGALFTRYGVGRITGWHELNSEGVFFVSETPTASYSYAARSPEWFSSFVGGSLNYANIRQGDGRTFSRRDRESAEYNIKTLMEQVDMIPQDQQRVMDFFDKQWGQLAEGTTPKLALIKRAAIDRRTRDFSAAYTAASRSWGDEDKTTSEVIKTMLSFYDNNDRPITKTTPASAITIIELPH